jgi:hypothetical protein
MRLENIEKYLNKKNIHYYESEDGKKICVPACTFDSKDQTNFYDYGEPYKEPQCYNKDKFFQELFNDSRVIVVNCSECCSCAGW